MDYSTFNAAEMAKLPEAKPESWTSNYISNSMGSGCAGDAPGFPSYFVQRVYTRNGNTPAKGPAAVIRFEGVYRVIERADKYPQAGEREALLRKLWQPLPLDHPRVRAWIESTYARMRHCYAEADRPEYGKPGTLIYPLPDYKLKHFHDDPRFNDVWREAEQTRIREENAFEENRARAIATPENHQAVRLIRSFYPEYQPDLDLIENPVARPGSWWETEAECPKPEECRPRSCGPHPVNHSWCQWCGWKAEEAV